MKIELECPNCGEKVITANKLKVKCRPCGYIIDVSKIDDIKEVVEDLNINKVIRLLD